MEGIELIAFEIISNVGMAKSILIETEFSLILMHAEDQMMSVEVIRALAEEMIEMCSELKK